jgi:hypothetical protein
MTTDPLDFGKTLAAKSDQLNAADLSGPGIVVKIVGATMVDSKEQPLILKLSGGHMPWKPCLGMRRLMAEVTLSTSARPWLGKWIRLYKDPDVRWANKPEGGIRISGIDASLLPSTRTFRVRDGRNSFTEYRIEPIRPQQEEGAPTADLDALLKDAGLTVADFDRWRATVNRPPYADLAPDERAKLGAWLAADSARIEALRPVDLRQQAPRDEPADLAIEAMRSDIETAIKSADHNGAALAAIQKVTGSVAARIADLTPEQVRAVHEIVCGGGE